MICDTNTVDFSTGRGDGSGGCSGPRWYIPNLQDGWCYGRGAGSGTGNDYGGKGRGVGFGASDYYVYTDAFVVVLEVG